MPDLGGELALRIAWDGQCVGGVTVRSTRPFAAHRLLAGKGSAEAIATVPLLFSVCRHAQHAAARAAIDAATEQRDHRRSRDVAVLLETVQEHLSHILSELPRAMAREGRIRALAAGRKRIDALLRTIDDDGDRVDLAAVHEVAVAVDEISSDDIYGMPRTAWLALETAEEVRAWARRGTTLPAALLDELLCESPNPYPYDVALMPPAHADILRSTVVPAMAGDSDFARAPTWNGRPIETGVLARTQHHRLVEAMMRRCAHPVALRLLARTVELALLLHKLIEPPESSADPGRVQAFAISHGDGMAAVQTARGLLLHRARIVDDRVAQYQIVAPTDWNFHPRGAAASALMTLAANDAEALERRATMMVQAFDPCVAYRIEIRHA
jgi:hypothetical protein